ncbi:hypothetical protein HY620_01835 [Candidatus Uhrbacteria bacterium]|nr:hypothetical protein [Candidatus Uhrbacteria bacterium]
MEPILDFSWIRYGIAGVAVCAAILFIIFKIQHLLRRPDLYGMSREEINKRWREIEALVQRNDEMSYKLAVMEADKLLDHGLKSMGFGGSSLGERLKLAAYKYPKIRNVWPAHLTRNKLVHEASFHLHRGTAAQAIQQFKSALLELGMLD